MAAYADVADRPDWLKALDRVAFNRYMRDRASHPRCTTLHATVDLTPGLPASIEYHSSGANWQHELALAATILERLKFHPELRIGAEIMQARLDAANQALDIRNIYLETGPVK